MIEINYKSDFVVSIEFVNGESVSDVPDYDFELIFSTGNGINYIISKQGELLINCKVSGTVLKGYFIGHNLGRGVMLCREILYLPNEDFDGGIQRIESVYQSGVCLIDGIGNELSATTINGVLPSSDYNTLYNKPQINGVELEGDLSGDDIKLNESFVSIDE